MPNMSGNGITGGGSRATAASSVGGAQKKKSGRRSARLPTSLHFLQKSYFGQPSIAAWRRPSQVARSMSRARSASSASALVSDPSGLRRIGVRWQGVKATGGGGGGA